MEWDERELKAKEAGDVLDCSDSTVYRMFRMEPQEGLPGDVREIRGYLVQKIPSSRADRYTSRQVEYLYNLKEGGVEVYEPEVIEDEDIETEPHVDEDLSEFRDQWSAIRQDIEEAQGKLDYVREQLQDRDALLDGDLWDLIDDERQDAVQQLESTKPKIVDVVFEVFQNMHILSDREARILEGLRKGTLSVGGGDRGVHDSGNEDDEDSEGGGETRDKSWLIDIDELEKANKQSEDGSESKALIYGGEPRHQRIPKFEKELGFDKVDWPSSQNGRKIQSAATRITNGHYDVVFVLISFASHSHEETLKRACCQLDVDFIPVPNGQSVSRLKRAYEEATSDKAS